MYTKFGYILCIYSQDVEQKTISDVNQGPQLCCKFAKNDALQSQRRSCQSNDREFNRKKEKKDGQGESSIAPTFSNGAVMKAFVIIFTSKDVVINQEAV